MTFRGELGTIRHFQRRNYDAFFWEIRGFSKLFNSQNDYYICEEFNFKNHRCYLEFYPRFMKCESQFFALYFRSRRSDLPSCVLHLTLGLRTGIGRIEQFFSGNIVFYEADRYGGPLILRAEFFKRKEELAPSDCLTFAIFFSSGALGIIRDVETSHVEENDKLEKKGNEKVADDMSKLLASGDRSDTTIVIEEVEYKVHSCILAARIPVFACLFKHDTIEKETQKIKIADCEPAIFKEFLNFIYSGSVQNLTAENVFGLYCLADKYLVQELKGVCRQCILDNMSSETFCEVVQLAQKCEDKYLLESAFDYCAANIRQIIRSVEWQSYIKENPIEANEILIRSFGPL